MEQGLAASPGGPRCRFQLPQEGRGWIHRAGPGADLAFSLLLFLTHTSPQLPQAERSAPNRDVADRQAGAGGFSQLGRTMAWHKRTDIAGEKHLKMAAREEQWAWKERAQQNHLSISASWRQAKAGLGSAPVPLPLAWVRKQLLTQK